MPHHPVLTCKPASHEASPQLAIISWVQQACSVNLCLDASQVEPEEDAQNKSSNERSASCTMKSSLLFLPSSPANQSLSSATAGAVAPASTPCASGLRFPPFTFPTSVDPPKADDTGAAIGIPIPLQTIRRISAGSTLPPLPSANACTAFSPPPATSAQSPSHSRTPCTTTQPKLPPRAEYRKIFVPSTVIHNGVVQQMLVPMMCIVTRSQQCAAVDKGSLSPSPPHTPNLAQRVSLPGTLGSPGARPTVRPAAPMHGSASGKLNPIGRGRGKQQQALKPLGPAYAPLKKVSTQSRYGTRASALPVESEEDVDGHAADELCTQHGDMDALNMLADAALLELY
jgi:hypothetical protein